ncbi:MAG: phosphoribosylamine--glycine ligase [Actinomycetota bacterium]
MRALIVGGGAREHCIAWSLARGRWADSVIAAPGNPGIGQLCECFDVPAHDIEGLIELTKKTRPDLVVIGPEIPLVAGLADALAEIGVSVFGPRKAAAMLEGSKDFAKTVMASRSVPTADHGSFDDVDEALAYLKRVEGQVVVKADGLAAGKGVVVCDSKSDARDAVIDAMTSHRFGDAGRTVLIEQRLFGEELSVLAFCDGSSFALMPPAQDYKQAYDYDQGPNTGGMGAFSPVPSYTEQIASQVASSIIEPVLDVLVDYGGYVGVLYAGLMLTDQGPKVIEFNCRFGDPETQALLPRLDSDLGEIMAACTQGSLAGTKIDWSMDACLTVVAASRGYPETERIVSGFDITGVNEAENVAGMPVFHAATQMNAGRLTTAGGRVLSVCAKAETVTLARQNAYEAISHIKFEGMRYRSDIGAEVRGRSPEETMEENDE